MASYKPRKCSKRWLDADCPDGVLAILDNRGKTFDRYMVIYSEPVCGDDYANMYLGYRGMSDNPCHPLGFGQWGEMSAHDVACYRHHNKHQYAKWSTLPDTVKALVRRDLTA